MSVQKLASNYAAYNLWANRQFVKWLSAKPGELLHKELPSSFSSIIKTLNHIWATEEYWYSVIAETPDFEKRYDAENLVTDEVFKGLLNRSELLKKHIDSLSDAELETKLKVVSPWFECELPKYEYLLHAVNHGTYHRGQIVTIGRNIGITDASNTDYNFYNVMKDKQP